VYIARDMKQHAAGKAIHLSAQCIRTWAPHSRENSRVRGDEATVRSTRSALAPVRRLAVLDSVGARNAGDATVALRDVHRALGINIPVRLTKSVRNTTGVKKEICKTGTYEHGQAQLSE
jgi:hypothetical protein